MLNNSLFQSVAAGLVLTFLGWLGLKAKKIRARIVAIWNSPTKSRNGVSQSQFDEFQNEMRKLMRPIQPEANGGKSLPDAIKTLDRIEHRLEDIGDTASATQATLKLHIETFHAHDK